MGALDTHVWVEERGAFVSEAFRRLAEVINDYDPRLFLAPMPDELRALAPDYPYAVIFENPNGKTDLVFRLKENEVNEQVLVRLWENDTQRTDVLSRMELQEKAQKALSMKAQIEEEEYRKDLANTILKSPLHTFQHNGRKYT